MPSKIEFPFSDDEALPTIPITLNPRANELMSENLMFVLCDRDVRSKLFASNQR